MRGSGISDLGFNIGWEEAGGKKVRYRIGLCDPKISHSVDDKGRLRSWRYEEEPQIERGAPLPQQALETEIILGWAAESLLEIRPGLGICVGGRR